MGHLFHGKLLVITRGYTFLYLHFLETSNNYLIINDTINVINGIYLHFMQQNHPEGS